MGCLEDPAHYFGENCTSMSKDHIQSSGRKVNVAVMYESGQDSERRGPI